MFHPNWLILRILHQSFEIERPKGHWSEVVVHLYKECYLINLTYLQNIFKAEKMKLSNIIPEPTVLPAKSDSDVMFCLQSYQGLIINRSLVYLSYPKGRINTQVIYLFALAH